MNIKDKLWTDKWSIIKYKPIFSNYYVHGFGSADEPDSSLWMSSLSEAMGEYFKEQMIVLDYGCGSARYGNFLSYRVKDFEYYGIDETKFNAQSQRFIISSIKPENIIVLDTELWLNILYYSLAIVFG